MPQLRGVLFITLILQIIGTAQVFLEPYLFTGGGPANATVTILLLIYRYAFGNSLGGNYGEATALSLLLAAVPRRHVPRLLPPHPPLEHLVTTTSPSADQPAARARHRRRAGTRRSRAPSWPARRGGADPQAPSPTTARTAARVSVADWRRPSVKWSLGTTHWLLLVLLVVWCLGPLLLLAKFAVTPTQDILRTPMAIFPNGIALVEPRARPGTTSTSASTSLNTIVARRRLLVQPDPRRDDRRLRALGAAPALRPGAAGGRAGHAVRPRRRAARAALPDHPRPARRSTRRWSTRSGRVWLPAGASAFNVVLVQRFFDTLPREIFEAARVDGAGPYRLFWSIVLPMSKPILGVVSVFAVIASWKDFLWPLLVLATPTCSRCPSACRPSRRPPTRASLMAALAISTLIPIVLFLVFQRMFLRGAGLGGAVKG